MNLIDISKAFATDEQCLEYLEQMRWPTQVRCVTCGGYKISLIHRQSKSKNKRARIYQCLEPTCKQQFSATTGTIFHDSHLPLQKWFMAIALMLNAKKGISALQLQRDLKVNYRTAWYVNHRIREVMVEGEDGHPMLQGIVEVDETYIGGKTIRRKDRGNRPLKKKDMVIGLRERGGPLRFVHVPDLKGRTVKEIIDKNISRNVEFIMTDDAVVYPFATDQNFRHKHRHVNHSKTYVEGIVHTNTIESAFSLLKRGIIGSFHKVSIKHLQRYLNEFSYRFNRRDKADIFSQTVKRLAAFPPLPYKKLVANPEPDAIASPSPA